MDDLRLRDVRIWRSVVRRGSFSGAARALRMSASAVTRAVDRLEEQLGASLLVRSTRRVFPTAAGERFLDHSAQLIEVIDDAQADVGAGGQVRGRLRLTAPASFGPRYLTPLLAEFLDQYPAIEVDVRYTDTIIDLVGERFDLAIRIGPPRDSDLIMRVLCRERRLICASADYLNRYGTPETAEELTTHNCILLGAEKDWTFIDVEGAARRVPVRGRMHTNFGHAILAAAEEGVGIARVSVWHAAPAIMARRLVPLMVDQTPESHGVIAALYPRAAYTPARVTAFVELLQTRLRTPPWEEVLAHAARS